MKKIKIETDTNRASVFILMLPSDGSFFLIARIFWGRLSDSFPTYAFFSFFLKVEISLFTLIPLFMPQSVHSGSASWDDCGRVLPDELHVSLLPWWVPTLCFDSIVRPLWLYWVKGVCVFRCILPHALLAEWPGSFRTTVITWGWNGHWMSCTQT